jgi:hypothetical protein
MNTYHAFYKGKKIEVKAATPYTAQVAASILLNAKKSYQVAVVLVAVGDKQVVHSTAEVG